MKPVRSRPIRILRDGSAYISVSCSVSFWILIALSFVPRLPLPLLTAFQVFKIMGVSLVLANVALLLRSKLWRVALPGALLMLFFTMYVMGS